MIQRLAIKSTSRIVAKIVLNLNAMVVCRVHTARL